MFCLVSVLIIPVMCCENFFVCSLCDGRLFSGLWPWGQTEFSVTMRRGVGTLSFQPLHCSIVVNKTIFGVYEEFLFSSSFVWHFSRLLCWLLQHKINNTAKNKDEIKLENTHSKKACKEEWKIAVMVGESMKKHPKRFFSVFMEKNHHYYTPLKIKWIINEDRAEG